MSGEIEAAGALATAGLVARAVDRGEAHADGPGGPCLNCSAALQGRYCHACGQAAHAHRTLAHVFEEFIHGIVHFDTRAWRTLPMVAGRPGTLTRNYIFGQRARYISPIALFLFAIFLMFFVFSVMGGVDPSRRQAARETLTELRADLARLGPRVFEVEKRSTEAGPGDRQEKVAASALEEARARLAERLAAAEARAALHKRALAQVEAELAAAADPASATALTAVKVALEQAVAGDGARAPGLQVTEKPDGTLAITQNLGGGEAVTENAVFAEIKRAHAEGRIHVNSGIKAVDKKINAKLANPELAWYKIQNTAYKFSFLLAPISMVFVALLFLFKRGVTLYDHAVFVLYSLSFMSFLLVLVRLLAVAGEAGEVVTGPLLAFAPPAHMFFHLKGTYALGWFSAFWRTLLLLFSAGLSLAIFIALIVGLGLVG